MPTPRDPHPIVDPRALEAYRCLDALARTGVHDPGTLLAALEDDYGFSADEAALFHYRWHAARDISPSR